MASASNTVNAPKRGWLSPINQRRWQNFKANRRGYWSLWIFLFLFFISLFAEFIANDRPYIMQYKGHTYYPMFNNYTEKVLFPDDPLAGIRLDYSDPFIQDEINANGWLAWPPIRYSHRSANKDIPASAPSKPAFLYESRAELCVRYPAGADDANCVLGNFNWLGTDDQARDVLARAIYGFRVSVLFGLILTFFSAIIGVGIGAIQGYYGGWTDLIGQRVVEIWSSLPQLYILLIVASVLPPGFWVLLFIMLTFSWVAFVGVVRAEFLRARNFEYVNAARALGLNNGKIMFRHLLPNAMVATLTFLPFILSGSIASLTSLDFLGFGLPPGSASLGEMVLQGKNNLQAVWLGFTGFIVLSLMLSLLVFIGEATRDAFDPRKTFS